jgi:hypothetical protein
MTPNRDRSIGMIRGEIFVEYYEESCCCPSCDTRLSFITSATQHRLHHFDMIYKINQHLWVIKLNKNKKTQKTKNKNRKQTHDYTQTLGMKTGYRSRSIHHVSHTYREHVRDSRIRVTRLDHLLPTRAWTEKYTPNSNVSIKCGPLAKQRPNMSIIFADSTTD